MPPRPSHDGRENQGPGAAGLGMSIGREVADVLGAVPQSGTCQCTLCRKNSGSVIWTSHKIRTLQFMWLRESFNVNGRIDLKASPFESPPRPETLGIYEATGRGIRRAFCTYCGGFLYWRQVSTPYLELAVGTVDAKYLFGEGGNVSFGFALANGGGTHIFCGNEIPGVTDRNGLTSCMGMAWSTHSRRDSNDGPLMRNDGPSLLQSLTTTTDQQVQTEGAAASSSSATVAA